MWLLDRMVRLLVRKGRLTIVDHDGKVFAYGNGEGSEAITVRLTGRRTAANIARFPQVGVGEAYMAGELVVQPPHDIRDLVLFAMSQGNKQKDAIQPRSRVRRVATKVAAKLDQWNNRVRSSKNVAHHYDLTREFYELFLDEDRQYSMAYFRDPANTLERAQIDKLALIAAKLRLGPKADASPMRVLDIGCGWGGLALYLNRHFGCEVLGVSLAPDQVRFAAERAAATGVADKVKFKLIDYRDVTGTFDRITNVGMLEHVGAPHFPDFFAKTNALLADDGIMLTHTIGRRSPPGSTDQFTRKYIFPGGYIPALSELVAAMERTGWEIADIEFLRYHYAYTIAEWYRRTCRHEAEITALYDARMFRLWQFYLAGAEQTFRHGNMLNFHIQTIKRRDAVPMTRDYIPAETARLSALDQAPRWHLDPPAE